MTLAELIALLEGGAEFDKTKAADFLRSEDTNRKETTKENVVLKAQAKEYLTKIDTLSVDSGKLGAAEQAKSEIEKQVTSLTEKMTAIEKEKSDLLAANKKSSELKLLTDSLVGVGLDSGRVTDHVEANYYSGGLSFSDDKKITYRGTTYDKPEQFAEAVKTANADWVKPVGAGSLPPAGNVTTSNVDYSKMSPSELMLLSPT